MHRALTERGIERGAASYVLAGESLDDPIIGRLVDRGLDDELKGTAYAVVDGVDGRTHHIKLPDLDAAGDSAPGSIVELRKFDDARASAASRSPSAPISTSSGRSRRPARPGSTGRPSPANRSRSAEAASAPRCGTRWTPRRASGREGLAERQGQRVSFSRNLIDTLRRREVDALGEKLAAETGQPFKGAGNGEYVAGTYRQRFALASGRFAMIDDGLGFQLVPWSPSLEKQLGRTSPASPAATAASTGASAASGGSVLAYMEVRRDHHHSFQPRAES
jgi:hypothetical protein